MKKLTLLVLCAGISNLILAGCSNDSEPFEEKAYTSDAHVNEIIIDVRDREIEVTLSEDEYVHIQYFENNKEYYKIYISDKGVLTMSSESNKTLADYFGTKTDAEYRTILIQVPDVLLENIDISTTNENITLSTLEVTGNVSLNSNGGDIYFDGLREPVKSCCRHS